MEVNYETKRVGMSGHARVSRRVGSCAGHNIKAQNFSLSSFLPFFFSLSLFIRFSQMFIWTFKQNLEIPDSGSSSAVSRRADRRLLWPESTKCPENPKKLQFTSIWPPEHESRLLFFRIYPKIRGSRLEVRPLKIENTSFRRVSCPDLRVCDITAPRQPLLEASKPKPFWRAPFVENPQSSSLSRFLSFFFAFYCCWCL